MCYVFRSNLESPETFNFQTVQHISNSMIINYKKCAVCLKSILLIARNLQPATFNPQLSTFTLSDFKIKLPSEFFQMGVFLNHMLILFVGCIQSFFLIFFSMTGNNIDAEVF